MEPPAASTIDAAWFSARDCCDSDDDDDDGDDEAQRAVAMRDAALCIAAVTQLLRERQCPAAAEAPLLVVLDNCVRLWRAKFGTWHAPCGNHLNVLDMLFVAACHLRVALNPAAVVAVDTDDVVALQARIVTALKEWDRAPASIHAEHRSIVRACECAVVVWGSNVAPTTRLADTTLSLEDVSLLTMNVNVHQNLDNRARNTDLPVVAAVETTVALDNNHDAAADDERVLANFVRLASRYAFFAMLHHAALLPCAQPRLLCHQQLAAHAARPPAAVVEANVARLHALLAERSLINMPESMQRNVNYTIWKRLLSVGSMEEYLRMAPTIAWHKLNPVTVSIREPTAATVPGSLARTVAGTDYHDTATAAEWPAHLRQCHREVWNLALWHQMFTEIDMRFLDDYVILSHDIRHKAELLGNSTRNWRPRLPVIVRACAAWCVHALSVVWHTDTLEECLYLWVWIVVRFFDCRDETGASLHQILQRAKLEFH